MLSKPHRITRGEHYRFVVRHGKRINGSFAVVSAVQTTHTNQIRFGFIVSKAVGDAVTRNRVRRRLKAIAFETLSHSDSSLSSCSKSVKGIDVVIRALPAAAHVSWDTLNREVSQLFARCIQGVSETTYSSSPNKGTAR